MSSKRPIAAIDLPDVTPGTPPTAKPEITWIDPTELLVDEAYQRGLSDKNLRLIARIVGEWDWRRFKPPITAWTDESLEVIDGQCTAIGAASHPVIGEIPVYVVDAAERADRASAFIGQNRDRVAITAAQMHAAAVVAGDEDALAVERVASRVGVRILRMPPSRGDYQPRQTVAVAAVAALIARLGEEDAERVLGILAESECAPITAAHIKAVDHLLRAPEFDGQVKADRLGSAIKELGLPAAEQEAKAFAATHCVPLWRGLAATWFQASRKRRRGSADASPRAEGASDRERPAGDPSWSGYESGRKADQTPSAADGAKRDERPPRGGWEPGRYMKRCQECDGSYVGGLRSITCAACAYGTAAAA
jgi:hypothetical protein